VSNQKHIKGDTSEIERAIRAETHNQRNRRPLPKNIDGELMTRPLPVASTTPVTTSPLPP
jgi:hypothetical protein